jgi:alanyl-tRNA synthetase
VADWIELAAPTGQLKTFVGYDTLQTDTQLLKYRAVTTKSGTSFQVVLEQTPFYAESGGQIGDTGQILMGTEAIAVLNTKKENDLIVHTVAALPENMQHLVQASVDAPRRLKITAHHTLTHLLHAALKQVLGSHVAQKGSMVADQGMRFDFSHFAKMTDDELAAVTTIVNERIRQNIPVVIQEMSKDAALQSGATALFGEKYGDVVRVVTIDPEYSVELCGGTHVGATGSLGFCIITSESGVAAGVRRIEAVCGEAAEAYHVEEQALIRQVSTLLKNPRDIIKAVSNQSDELAAAKRQTEQLEQQLAGYIKMELLQTVEQTGAYAFVGALVSVGSAELLKKICNELRMVQDNIVVMLCARIGDKPAVAIGIADKLVQEQGLDAVQLIKTKVAGLIKGGGGGQKGLATAGGQELSGLEPAIQAVKTSLL